MRILNKTSNIDTVKGPYTYNEVIFTRGEKKIDRTISKKNLLDLKQHMDKNHLKFALIYGTLLGAIREKNFIEHDEDTDLLVFMEDRENFLNTLFDLRELGFEVGRYEKKMISLIRDGEYIDLYFFKKKGFNTRECDGYVIKSKYLDTFDKYEFLGDTFYIPKNSEELLNSLYGLDWRVPNKEGSTMNYGLYLKIKIYIREHFKALFNILSWSKHRIYFLLNK